MFAFVIVPFFKLLGNINWEVLLLAKLEKLIFTVEFLTAANTLI